MLQVELYVFQIQLAPLHFGANRLHQVLPVKGPLARVTLGAFVSFDRDKKDVLVWA